jgi:hypothetical protein
MPLAQQRFDLLHPAMFEGASAGSSMLPHAQHAPKFEKQLPLAAATLPPAASHTFTFMSSLLQVEQLHDFASTR